MSQWTIGRAPDCDVIVEEAGISRYHARLTQTGRGFVIEDLGSSSGTLLNGAPLHGATPIRAGDTIGLGPKYLLRTQSGQIGEILRRGDFEPSGPPQPHQAPARPQAAGGSKAPAIMFALILLIGIGVAVFMVMKKSDGNTDQNADGSVSGALNVKEIKQGTQSLVVGDEAFCTASSYAEKDGTLTLSTNRHCIEGYLKGTGGFTKMQVEFVTEKKVDVESFELERTGKDLARLNLKSEGLTSGEDYVLVPRLAKGDELSETNDVVAIGSSAGNKWSFSDGIVSRLGCPDPSKITGASANEFPPDFKCIQFNAAISGGNSGGPLFRKDGDKYVWIGINTLASQGGVQNLNFAIHVEEFFERDYESFEMSQEGIRKARAFMN